MALQLSLELASGVSGDYWKITDIVLDYGAAKAEVYVALYKDAAARAANKEPMFRREYEWTGADFTGWLDAATLSPVDKNPQERAYVKLKTLADFTGATDV